eukprot:12743874-Alexandrium_andersonii.AAC.1
MSLQAKPATFVVRTSSLARRGVVQNIVGTRVHCQIQRRLRAAPTAKQWLSGGPCGAAATRQRGHAIRRRSVMAH